MAGSQEFPGFPGRKMAKPPEKSAFWQTCSRLSQYLKEKGSFGDLSFGMTCHLDGKGKSDTQREAGTMDILPRIAMPREVLERKESASDGSRPPVPLFTQRTTSLSAPGLVEDAQKPNRRPTTASEAENAQMTIFYAGRVLVFDSFPADKAKELMHLASKGCVSQSAAPPASLPSKGSSQSMGPPASVPNQGNPSNALPPVPIASKGSSQTLGPVPLPSLGSSQNLNSALSVSDQVATLQQPNLNEPPPPSEQHDPNVASSSSGTPVQDNVQRHADGSDLPIARRNSLHRFLEKRKGRINSKAPYPVTAAAGAQGKPDDSKSWLGLGPSSD